MDKTKEHPIVYLSLLFNVTSFAVSGIEKRGQDDAQQRGDEKENHRHVAKDPGRVQLEMQHGDRWTEDPLYFVTLSFLFLTHYIQHRDRWTWTRILYTLNSCS